MEILFFPGKNTPLKRYTSYFPGIELSTQTQIENPTLILCHSKGLKNAIEYVTNRNIQPMIIAMDGVHTDIPKNIKVISFRPDHKKNLGDEHMYHDIIYYTMKENTHHPYMQRNIRDKIIETIQKISK